MSAIAESLRRQRLPLLTVTALVLLGAIAWAVVSRTTAQHLTRPDYPTAAPAIEQAKWNVSYDAGGKFGKMSKADRTRFVTRSRDAAALVQAIYDGIFLTPERLEEVVKSSFSQEAARSLDTKRLGFPAGATEVKTTMRRARITLNASSGDYAVGRIAVRAQADVGARDVVIEHRSTLYLTRYEDGWKVIAFDLEQGPKR